MSSRVLTVKRSSFLVDDLHDLPPPAPDGDHARRRLMRLDALNDMHTFTAYPQPLAMKPTSVDPLRASVAHLLSRAGSLPCSAVAQSYMQLVPPTSRFTVALDVLFPLLDSSAEVSAPFHTVAVTHFWPAQRSFRNAFSCPICYTHSMQPTP